MNNEDALYKIENIKIKIDSKKINLSSAEVILYNNYLNIKPKNETKKFKIFYEDITFMQLKRNKK